MGDKYNRIVIAFGILAVMVTAGMTVYNDYQDSLKNYLDEIYILTDRNQQLEYDLMVIQQMYNEKVDEVRELKQQIKELEKWTPIEVEATGYAPLDPQAVEGVCYSGDPTVTASGEPSQPGISIAAGPGVPFGTEMYVPGYGVGVVHDRGGMISDKHIDLMFATRGQALNWGRQTVTVWVKE